MTSKHDEKFQELLAKLAISPLNQRFDAVVCINGDHNIPSALTQAAEDGESKRRLRLCRIESEFLDRMFNVEEV